MKYVHSDNLLFSQIQGWWDNLPEEEKSNVSKWMNPVNQNFECGKLIK